MSGTEPESETTETSDIDQIRTFLEKIAPGIMNDPNATRVAVIDNDPTALWGMAILLAEWGCAPFLGTNAQTAAQALRAADTTPDLILSDYELDDGLTGVEVIHALRTEFGADLRAALITGRVTPTRKFDADKLNVTIFTKPLRTSHLQSFVLFLGGVGNG